MLKFCFNIPQSFVSKAAYAVDCINQRSSLAALLCFNQPQTVEVLYSDNLNISNIKQQLRVPFQPEWYLKEKLNPDLVMQLQNFVASGFSSESGANLDLIGVVYRFLNLLDEVEVPTEQLDRRGIFLTSALPLWRRQLLNLPVVDLVAQSFKDRVLKVYPGLVSALMPYWPSAKNFALVITHDTDVLRAGALNEILSNSLKALLRKSRTNFQMAKAGIVANAKPIVEDPLFGFQKWAQLEDSLGVKSQFLLSTATNRMIKRDLNDCKSYLSENTPEFVWQILRQLHVKGWEFGLHPPINAKRSLDYFLWSKSLIEKKLQAPVYGLRHHYWSIDWQKPQQTFRKHVNAGLRFDMSIAWRDQPGFRAATCFPYRPFDPMTAKAFNLWELPTTLLEKHVLGQHVKHVDPLSLAYTTIQAVKSVKGPLVVDWHTETIVNNWEYLGFVDGFKKIIEPEILSQDSWLTTPWALVKHWQIRSKKVTFSESDALNNHFSQLAV